MNDIHDMTEAMKAEFLGAFRAHFGFGEMTATANDDAASMLKAAAWAWQASRSGVVVELPAEWATNVGKMLPTPGVRRAIEAQGLKVVVKP
ncbi:hypothetical protein D3C76_1585420 [compost metagenome]